MCFSKAGSFSPAPKNPPRWHLNTNRSNVQAGSLLVLFLPLGVDESIMAMEFPPFVDCSHRFSYKTRGFPKYSIWFLDRSEPRATWIRQLRVLQCPTNTGDMTMSCSKLIGPRWCNRGLKLHALVSISPSKMGDFSQQWIWHVKPWKWTNKKLTSLMDLEAPNVETEPPQSGVLTFLDGLLWGDYRIYHMIRWWKRVF